MMDRASMQLLAYLATLMIGGCATATTIAPIAYGFADRPDRQRVEVHYKNTTDHLMCLSPDDWPNAAGKINQASDVVILSVSGQRFPVDDFNTGYCIGGCLTYVEPGEEISGFIAYEDFKLPLKLAQAPKTLAFSPKAYSCSRKRH